MIKSSFYLASIFLTVLALAILTSCSVIDLSEVRAGNVTVDYNTGMATVVLQTTDRTVPNHPYTIELYERGKLRDTTTMTWNKTQISNHVSIAVGFQLSISEVVNYYKESGEVFTAKVRK